MSEERDGEIVFSFADELSARRCSGLSALRGQRLDLAVADAIEALDAGAATSREQEVADHLLKAASPGPRPFVERLVDAGKAAINGAAFESALATPTMRRPSWPTTTTPARRAVPAPGRRLRRALSSLEEGLEAWRAVGGGARGGRCLGAGGDALWQMGGPRPGSAIRRRRSSATSEPSEWSARHECQSAARQRWVSPRCSAWRHARPLGQHRRGRAAGAGDLAGDRELARFAGRSSSRRGTSRSSTWPSSAGWRRSTPARVHRRLDVRRRADVDLLSVPLERTARQALELAAEGEALAAKVGHVGTQRSRCAWSYCLTAPTPTSIASTRRGRGDRDDRVGQLGLGLLPIHRSVPGTSCAAGSTTRCATPTIDPPDAPVVVDRPRRGRRLLAHAAMGDGAACRRCRRCRVLVAAADAPSPAGTHFRTPCPRWPWSQRSATGTRRVAPSLARGVPDVSASAGSTSSSPSVWSATRACRRRARRGRAVADRGRPRRPGTAEPHGPAERRLSIAACCWPRPPMTMTRRYDEQAPPATSSPAGSPPFLTEAEASSLDSADETRHRLDQAGAGQSCWGPPRSSDSPPSAPRASDASVASWTAAASAPDSQPVPPPTAEVVAADRCCPARREAPTQAAPSCGEVLGAPVVAASPPLMVEGMWPWTSAAWPWFRAWRCAGALVGAVVG